VNAPPDVSAKRCLRVAFVLYGFHHLAFGAAQCGMALWLGSLSTSILVAGVVTATSGILLIRFERPLAALPFHRATSPRSTSACYLAAGLCTVGAIQGVESIAALVTQVAARWVSSSAFEPLPPVSGSELTTLLVLAATGIALALASARLATLWDRWNACPASDRA